MRRNNWYDEPSGQSEIDFGFGPQNKLRSEPPRVQILTPYSYKEELQKPKLCSQCSRPISFIQQSNCWICYTCQLTWVKDFDTPLSSTENAIKPLQSNDPYERESPAFVSAKRKPSFREGQNKDPDFEVAGTLQRARITTSNLGAVTEERIRKALGEDAAYGY